jgi:hypothetical protein
MVARCRRDFSEGLCTMAFWQGVRTVVCSVDPKIGT